MSDAPVLLKADDVRKTYHLGQVEVPVLTGTTLDVHRGEWIAVLGASGSGKSTLLHLMGDLDHPDADGGEVWFEGRPLSGYTGRMRNAMTVPGAASRRLDWVLRDGMEYAPVPPDYQYRADEMKDRPDWWTPTGGAYEQDSGMAIYD